MKHLAQTKSTAIAQGRLPATEGKTSKRDALLESINDAVNCLAERLQAGKSETLVHYLECMSRFHNYSFNNILLIAMQSPEAEQVAGFATWKKLGRAVKKGEKGIAILAPMIGRKNRDADNNEADSDQEKKVFGFRVVHVFDISQTEGKPLAEFAGIEGEAGQYFARLKALTEKLGIQLKEETIPGGALGVSRGGTIAIRPDLSDAEAVAVLTHEISHELLHKSEERRKQTDKAVRETEAEAVAFVVCKHIGLETTTRSSDYIQLYRGDTETLAASLQAIQQTAATILRAIGAE